MDRRAGEIDASDIGRAVDVRRAIEARIGKIRRPVERAVGEKGGVVEGRAIEMNTEEPIRSAVRVLRLPGALSLLVCSARMLLQMLGPLLGGPTLEFERGLSKMPS